MAARESNGAAGWPTGEIADELELIRERAARIPALAVAMTEDDQDEAHDILRNVAGALQVQVTYLKEQ
jgi:hypothetical protein